jgi:restriction system protein
MKDDVPPFHELMWPTLQALKMLNGSGTNQEIVAKIIEIEQISEEAQNIPSKDGRRSLLEYRASWARTYLKYIGAIENSERSVWALTDKGETLDSPSTLSEYEAYERYRNSTIKETEATQNTSPFNSNASENTQLLVWSDHLIDVLLSLAPDAFERLCQRLLRESGFTKVEVTGRSGDGGIDGKGILKVNLLSFHVSFQCKRYRNSVGASAIRDFRGAFMGRADRGIILTTGTFTSDARREAIRDGALPIDLIDGEELCELLKKLQLGVRTKLKEEVIVMPEWFAAI